MLSPEDALRFLARDFLGELDLSVITTMNNVAARRSPWHRPPGQVWFQPKQSPNNRRLLRREEQVPPRNDIMGFADGARRNYYAPTSFATVSAICPAMVTTTGITSARF